MTVSTGSFRPFAPARDSRESVPHLLAVEPLPATPFLRMNLDAVVESYRRMHAALPGVRIHFAMKCNPDPQVLLALHGAGAAFEIASATELDLLRSLRVPSNDVIFSNPVKPSSHVRRAAVAGVDRFAVDSTAELHKVATQAPGAKVYVRLSASDGSSIVASEGKFGVSAEEATRLLREARELGLEPYGLAFHVGSQMLDPEAWTDAVRASATVMRSLEPVGIRLSMLDLGGGFPARYDAEVPPIEEYGRRILEAVAMHVPYPVDLVAEPGRALVAEAGTMVAEVIGTAERWGRTWVHLDVGAFNGMMEALETQNRLRFPIRDSRRARRKQSVHLTGPSCDSQDTILFDVAVSQGIQAGDMVYIGTAGAYTTSYASNFNGFEIPRTVV